MLNCLNYLIRSFIHIPSVHGDISGLKRNERDALERLYRRRVPAGAFLTPELARALTDLSRSLNRQLGLLVTREGAVSHVIIGDTKGIYIPSLEGHPLGRRAMRGLRLVHTHLKGEGLSQDDLADLALLRLDFLMMLDIEDDAFVSVQGAHIGPQGVEHMPVNLHRTEPDFREFIAHLESEMARRRTFDAGDTREKALLVSVSTRPRHEQEDSADELRELAQSCNVLVLDTVIQRPKEINPRTLMGEGRLRELIIEALTVGATLLIFDQDLTPSQGRAIAEMTELKVIDRSQLILDIFARRAHSADGKVQVELAQLKYRLPRLTGKGTAMSRLMGGIGGRGPGEMKLEVDRRRVRDRISLLEKQLKSLGLARKQRKQRRERSGLPIVSIVGYTNAGKSTLLNALTESATHVEQKMFATLDTASRRLRFPRERDVIITDTVGFIRDLPPDLAAAFKATLEELDDAHLLLHVVDAANPRYEQQMASVEKVLTDLGVGDKTRLLALNKIDKLPPDEAAQMATRHGAICISAREPRTLAPLLQAIEQALWQGKLV